MAVPSDNLRDVAEYTDPHGDKLTIGIEPNPIEWPVDAGPVRPVIHVTGDAYLTAQQAREASRHLAALGVQLLVLEEGSD